MIGDRGWMLTRFGATRPSSTYDQRTALTWLANAHTEAQATLEGLSPEARDAFAARMRRVIDRCACGPSKIGSRGTVLEGMGDRPFSELAVYDVTKNPRGAGMGARNAIFADVVRRYFEDLYRDETSAPSDVVHVTCTGYVSPSGAQRVVAEKGWTASTRVTHAYHMGCYAAFPATRVALGLLGLPRALAPSTVERRVDVVHTELCSLHMDPSNHSVEQIVVQSLFADGFIRYSAKEVDDDRGLEVLALDERVVPDSADAMSWALSDHGMAMTLSRDVPGRIGEVVRAFVIDLFARADLDWRREMSRAVFAVHPGGPKIIDGTAEALELREEQVAASRAVLFDFGNMSSATLPHIWMRVLDDAGVPRGAHVVSLAFGPGLTVCGGVFRKR